MCFYYCDNLRKHCTLTSWFTVVYSNLDVAPNVSFAILPLVSMTQLVKHAAARSPCMGNKTAQALDTQKSEASTQSKRQSGSVKFSSVTRVWASACMHACVRRWRVRDDTWQGRGFPTVCCFLSQAHQFGLAEGSGRVAIGASSANTVSQCSSKGAAYCISTVTMITSPESAHPRQYRAMK